MPEFKWIKLIVFGDALRTLKPKLRPKRGGWGEMAQEVEAGGQGHF